MQNKDEIYVEELFLDKYQLKFHKIEEGDIKTPDYYVKEGENTFAVAEVKGFIADFDFEDGSWTKNEDGIYEKEKEDNGPSRVARKIIEGYKQLVHYSEPKILIFVNHESALDIVDLQECCNGYLDYSNGTTNYRNNASRRIALGKLKDVKNKIDLYIWIDTFENDQIYFRYSSKNGHYITFRYFQEK
jgi:hypothetical protein